MHPVAQLSGQKQKENGIDILNKDHVNYDVAISPVVTEYKSTVYYNANVKSKSAIGRFFVGDHVTAHMQTSRNSAIPFLAKGDGISTEVSTQSTNLTVTYFKAMPQINDQNIANMYQRKMQPLSSDTKLGMSVPFLPQLKFFGGYSYNRSMEVRLVKGPSFGFQADLFKYANINTTIVKPTEGKAAAKVLFSLNIPFDRIAF
ncbi:MAG: hypothetical protein Q8S21_02855 [Candidatus Paracaedibacteraceae bacterium]|nr:hypothetical protein [Candidatus Paracaedibacteraceae bacterium]